MKSYLHDLNRVWNKIFFLSYKIYKGVSVTIVPHLYEWVRVTIGIYLNELDYTKIIKQI